MALRSTSVVDTIRPEPPIEASLFERFPRLYAFFRERLFRDDTEQIVATLWPDNAPEIGSTLIELGCGPGFYSRRLSERFPNLNVVGLDRSTQQLELAADRANTRLLPNCRFEWGDAQAIGFASGSVDAVIASRLFTVLPNPALAVSEIHRVLLSNGRCFIAEPRPHPIAHVPLGIMWLVAGTANLLNRGQVCYREPDVPTLLQTSAFFDLVSSQPWREMHIWADGRYQYAVCTKA